MSPDALVLREVSDGAWRDFAGRVQSSAGAREYDDTTLTVLPHWQRAVALGASLQGPAVDDELLRGESLKEHLERSQLVLRLCARDLERAASVVAPHEYVLLLADASGVVVQTRGGGRFSDEARRVRLMPGARWSEGARGTNAIGTAIAERRPVFVRGSAHLARSFHELVCYSAPIFDADGSLVAVLDATSSMSWADDTIGDAVTRAADAVMQALRERALGQAGAGVSSALARALERMNGLALLVEPPGRIARMNAGARLLLGPRAGATTEEVLGLDLAALAREGREAHGLSLLCEGRRYHVRVDPIQTFEGRLIALLVFLEPTSSARGARPARPAPPSAAFSSVFSRDAGLDEALSLARRIADSPLPVLLLAETGAGKELVARAIHDASARAREPFVAVNCGAIAPSLLESELFGYGPAAFTGAERAGRQGLFAAAAKGTIFLDEVGEMPPAMQAALLRVLEDGSYRRVGESRSQHVDVRVVSATCKDLKAMVEAGSFRRDLFYRLKGAEIDLPPLRARSDRSALAEHLLGALARKRGVPSAPRLSPAVLERIERYGWPGNVRELATVLDVSLILAAGQPLIELAHLPPEFRRESELPARSRAPVAELATVEAATLRRVLDEVGGNVSLAAKRLGVARSTVYRMMRRHDI
jgi:transcriptional regulator of acetoin/glycerol metabolism